MKKAICALLVLAFYLAAGSAQADKVFLKNGKEISGKIVEQGQYSLRVKVGEANFTYYYKEIDRIERDQPEPGQGPALPEKVSEKKRELILRLLESNKARTNIAFTFSQIIEQAPEESRPLLKKILKVEDIIARLIPVYSKYYSEQDLADLLAFYSSPIGQKYLEVTPKVLEDTMRETVKYFQDKVAEQE